MGPNLILLLVLVTFTAILVLNLVDLALLVLHGPEDSGGDSGGGGTDPDVDPDAPPPPPLYPAPPPPLPGGRAVGAGVQAWVQVLRVVGSRRGGVGAEL